MKLVFCFECSDLIRLKSEAKTCDCGRVGGYYYTNNDVVTWGKCVPVGIDNLLFANAVRHRTKYPPGKVFGSWVIAKECLSITHFKTKRGADGHVQRTLGQYPRKTRRTIRQRAH